MLNRSVIVARIKQLVAALNLPWIRLFLFFFFETREIEIACSSNYCYGFLAFYDVGVEISSHVFAQIFAKFEIN